jgi:LytR cell envelope-related transcriptional attenuator
MSPRFQRPAGPRRDERGLVLPTRLMVFSISLVALAGLGFIATQSGDDTPDKVTPAAHSTPTAPPVTVTEPTPSVTPPRSKPAPTVDRGKVLVAIFNNSNVQGLAGKTGTRVQRAGWSVVGTDNWYGTIDTSTVYFGPRMKAAADLLAQDLGITRVKAAIPPMRPDRLTVILTADYH